jgi:hypothetical protein
MGDQSPLFEQEFAIFLGDVPNCSHQMAMSWRELNADAVWRLFETFEFSGPNERLRLPSRTL